MIKRCRVGSDREGADLNIAVTASSLPAAFLFFTTVDATESGAWEIWANLRAAGSGRYSVGDCWFDADDSGLCTKSVSTLMLREACVEMKRKRMHTKSRRIKVFTFCFEPSVTQHKLPLSFVWFDYFNTRTNFPTFLQCFYLLKRKGFHETDAQRSFCLSFLWMGGNNFLKNTFFGISIAFYV